MTRPHEIELWQGSRMALCSPRHTLGVVAPIDLRYSAPATRGLEDPTSRVQPLGHALRLNRVAKLLQLSTRERQGRSLSDLVPGAHDDNLPPCAEIRRVDPPHTSPETWPLLGTARSGPPAVAPLSAHAQRGGSPCIARVCTTARRGRTRFQPELPPRGRESRTQVVNQQRELRRS